MFDFIERLEPAEATAAIHFAVSRLTHRAYWVGTEQAMREGTFEDGEADGMRILQEIETKEGRRLNELSNDAALSHIRSLLDRAERLNAPGELPRDTTNRVIAELRNMRIDALRLDVLTQRATTTGLAWLAVYMAALIVLMVFTGFVFWPTGPYLKEYTISPEVRIFVCVAVFGGFGSLLRMIATLSSEVAGRTRLHSVAWYFWRAPFGAVGAAVLYMVVRAFLIAPNAPAEAMNIFGLASISFLAGTYTDDAIRKLLARLPPVEA